MEIASGTWIVVLLRVALEVTAEWVKSDRLKNKPTYKTYLGLGELCDVIRIYISLQVVEHFSQQRPLNWQTIGVLVE